MCLAVYFQQMSRVDVRVSLRGREAGMAQKFLNGTKICTALQQVRREAVPQAMGTQPLGDCRLPDPK